jgi:hypothetical protein
MGKRGKTAKWSAMVVDAVAVSPVMIAARAGAERHITTHTATAD